MTSFVLTMVLALQGLNAVGIVQTDHKTLKECQAQEADIKRQITSRYTGVNVVSSGCYERTGKY